MSSEFADVPGPPGAGQNAWVEAAEQQPAPAPDGPTSARAARALVLVGAHGGAGETTWAGILSAAASGGCMPPPEANVTVVLVARMAAGGIAAAKAALAQQHPAVEALLAVPAAPGRVPPEIRRELTVLGGAVPVVRAPWVPGLLLRTPETATESDVPPRGLAQLRQQLPQARHQQEGGHS